MSNESQLPFYSKQSDDGTSTLYYLRNDAADSTGDTEITEAQYNALTDALASVVPEKTSFTEAELIEMHQAQAGKDQGPIQTAAEGEVAKPQVHTVPGDVHGEIKASDVNVVNQTVAQAAEPETPAPVVEAEVPSTDTPNPEPTPDPVSPASDNTAVDLTDHPVVSSELVEPTVAQPAPPHLSTIEEIEAWGKKEEARIEAWIQGLKGGAEPTI